ncbi:MAG: tetrahydromethanopterin S-methyltransferase subunit H [Methanosarcinaceae archaeon]|jgi:tetrahydromethanopterin S-methyltransferase subunit H|nr:tetrahydromethanopterin S-methyltransferase subunit H [Methanosarcinaceae archaeon]
MYRFKKEQQIVKIAKVKIGGQPGALPTVLAGTIFYSGHSIVENHLKGIFDKKKAELLVNIQDSNSDETLNPSIVHIFGTTAESIINYINFIVNITDAPIIIDSTEQKVRMHAIRYATEVGFADKIIYNSINMSISEDEKKELKQSNIDTSIVLGFNAMDSTLQGRMDLLENGGKLLDVGLLDIAKTCGIKNILIDPSITPLGDGAGVALRMSLTAKAKWGHPIGSGIHNAPSAWNWLKEKKKEDPYIYKMCDIGSINIQQMAGGDFVLYGPIDNAQYAFPMAAMTDIMLSEATSDLETETANQHPINVLV